jgi:hypothetical protein
MSPVQRGLAAGALVLALTVALSSALGWRGTSPFDWRFWLSGLGWFEALQAALIGYSVAVPGLLREGARTALRELAPKPDVEGGDVCVESAPRALSVAVTLLGVALGAALALNPASWPDGWPAPSFLLWTTFRASLLAALALTSALATVTLSLRLSRAGERTGAVDPLDAGAFVPLAHFGLRTVSMTLFLAVLALVLPARGAHRRLQEAREARLARVRAAIRVRTGDEPTAEAPFPSLSLADLLAYEERLRGASTWPYDLGALLRFGAYLALGLGSWVGAAIVERALGAVLG